MGKTDARITVHVSELAEESVYAALDLMGDGMTRNRVINALIVRGFLAYCEQHGITPPLTGYADLARAYAEMVADTPGAHALTLTDYAVAQAARPPGGRAEKIRRFSLPPLSASVIRGLTPLDAPPSNALYPTGRFAAYSRSLDADTALVVYVERDRIAHRIENAADLASAEQWYGIDSLAVYAVPLKRLKKK